MGPRRVDILEEHNIVSGRAVFFDAKEEIPQLRRRHSSVGPSRTSATPALEDSTLHSDPDSTDSDSDSDDDAPSDRGRDRTIRTPGSQWNARMSSVDPYGSWYGPAAPATLQLPKRRSPQGGEYQTTEEERSHTEQGKLYRVISRPRG